MPDIHETHETDSEKTVVVLGGHKSGTSATAGVLQLLGVTMGDRLRDADARNPTGYFEDMDILRINDEILQAADADAWHPPDRQTVMSLRNQFDGRIADVIASRNQRYHIWGWKVTTTNITIDLFLPHLRNPHFVVVLRNPLHVAMSSIEHTAGNTRLLEALDLAIFWNRAIVDFLTRYPKYPNLIIGYENLVAEPAATAQKIAGFLNMKLQPHHLDDVEQFIIPRDRIKQVKAGMRIRERFKNWRLGWLYRLWNP